MAEPLAHSRIIVAKRHAAVEVFGPEGLDQISQALPAEVRAETIDSSITETWIPERWVMEWQRAVWQGPAAENTPLFYRFVDSMVAQGFGRVRRVLVKLATPSLMCERAAELWRDEHTHGVLTAQVSKHAAQLRLSEHPYCTSKLAAMVMSESMRYAGSLSARAGDVTTSYGLAPGALVVDLHWT